MIDDDIYALAEEVLQAARAAGLKIATAESCTGGLVMGALTAVPGSSDVVERGFITYSNVAKAEALGVPSEVLKAHGAVSEPTAKAMADGAMARARVQLVVSLTGVAGPGAAGPKPEGMVCFGLAKTGAETVTQDMRFGALGRAEVRKASVKHALELLRDAAGAGA